MKIFSILMTLVNALAWNVLIYFVVESYRGHSNFSAWYLSVATIGCIAVTKLKILVDENSHKEEPNEGS